MSCAWKVCPRVQTKARSPKSPTGGLQGSPPHASALGAVRVLREARAKIAQCFFSPWARGDARERSARLCAVRALGHAKVDYENSHGIPLLGRSHFL